MPTEDSFDLVPTRLAVQAMRDNGYRNTAYAVAELIDNSIQAEATNVELLCCESEELVRERVRRRIKHIAVLDNGSGMDDAVLRMALQFGNGTHLDDRSGIGRFGMGLPSASISQCRKVEVWSWQHGPDKARYSYIDLKAVEDGSMREVPAPQERPLPAMWVEAARSIGATGTLVTWSALDRAMWRTANTVIRNSEFVIARMYRRFLDEGKVSIRLAAFTDDNPSRFSIDEYAIANDPGYTIVPSSTPTPYDEQAMFQQDGDNWEVRRTIRFRDEDCPVVVRFTYAKEEARESPNAGNTEYGRHAGKNVGVSLVRAERELDMDQALVVSYEPRERWWGVEVEFPPALDELFGVTNNKQSARNFSEVASNFKTALIGTGAGTSTEMLDELIEADDPNWSTLRDHQLDRSPPRHTPQSDSGAAKGDRQDTPAFRSQRAEVQGTEVTRERQQEGHRGFSDAGEERPEEERKEELKNELVDSGLSEQQAEELAARTIDSGIKYTFAEADLEGRSFFTVRPVAGEIVIKINVNHPAYKNLVEVLEEEVAEEATEAELRDRLLRANRGLKLLLIAWARYEDEQPTDAEREQIQDIRTDWGRVAYRFLRTDEASDGGPYSLTRWKRFAVAPGSVSSWSAPFAKEVIVQLLLAATPVNVSVEVVVRWLPFDIKVGVSDLEVWDIIRDRPGADLFVRQDLHAKYYRADDRCLVGSANLTGATLGLSLAPNFELLASG